MRKYRTYRNCFFTFLLLGIGLTNTLLSQTNKETEYFANPIIKALLDSLSLKPKEEIKTRLLNKLAWNYAVVDFEKGMNYANEAFYLSDKLGLDLEKGTALNTMGEIFSLKGNISESISKHKEALGLFKSTNNKNGIANTYKLLGFSYYHISDFKRALEFFNTSLEVYQNIKDKEGIAILQSHLGNLYGTLDEDAKALKQFEISLSYFNSVGDSASAAVNFANIGLLNYKKGNLKGAINNYLEAIRVFKALSDENNYATYLGNAGLVYVDLREYGKANAFFYEALEISQKRKDDYGIAFENANLGMLNYKMALDKSFSNSTKLELLNKAVGFYNMAIEKIEKLGLTNDKKNYLFELSSVYKEMGNFKKALEYYTKAGVLKDSLFSESNKKAIAELELKQQLKEKEKEFLILNNEKDYQLKVNRSLVVILILLGVIIVLVVYTSNKQKKINADLQTNIIKREEIERTLRFNELELKKYQDHLENLVKERTVELENENRERLLAEKEALAAKDKAEKSDKLKSEFLAQMSHEIRTPINIINGFNSILKEELKDSATESVLSAMTNLKNASDRIMRTVDMVLKMSEVNLQTANVSLTTFDICEKVTDEVYEKYTSIALNKGLAFNYKIETENKLVCSDDYYLFQIIINILDNAIKYTDKGHINFIVKRSATSQLELVVEDTGIGIAEEFLPNLFEPFLQEEQGYARSYEGNGLGLSLVKKYCELIGADIMVDSKKDVGSTFTLIINNEQFQNILVISHQHT